jgi:hypothetical protein
MERNVPAARLGPPAATAGSICKPFHRRVTLAEDCKALEHSLRPAAVREELGRGDDTQAAVQQRQAMVVLHVRVVALVGQVVQCRGGEGDVLAHRVLLRDEQEATPARLALVDQPEAARSLGIVQSTNGFGGELAEVLAAVLHRGSHEVRQGSE